ncbi:hypothetical protein GCM10028821_22090 [Hymenobacter jeollabukensis]
MPAAHGEALSPTEALGRWQELIQEILAGYCDIPPELDNDLDVAREPLEHALHQVALLALPERQLFAQHIQALDEVFKSVTVEHPEWGRNDATHWWEGRVLTFAGREYRNFCGFGHSLKQQGIIIQPLF